MELVDILKGMDPSDDNQWTAQGLPKLDYLSLVLGEKVTRKDVDALGTFTREEAAEERKADGSITEPQDRHSHAVTDQQKEDAQAILDASDVSPIEAMIAQAKGECDRIRADIKRSQEELERAVALYDELRTEATVEESFTERNMRFIRVQNELRIQRHQEQQEAFKALGMRPVSPIDQALAQRRETDRPKMKVQH